MANLGPVATVIRSYIDNQKYRIEIKQPDFEIAVDIIEQLAKEKLAASSLSTLSEAKEMVSISPVSSGEVGLPFSSFIAAIGDIAYSHFPAALSAMKKRCQLSPLEQAASSYAPSAYHMLDMRFPFALVSRELSMHWLARDIKEGRSKDFKTVVRTMLKEAFADNALRPQTHAWEEIQTIVDALRPQEVSLLLSHYSWHGLKKPLKVYYLHEYYLHVLLKMAICKEHPLPDAQKLEWGDLELIFRDCLKDIALDRHPTPLRLVEIVLHTDPKVLQADASFREFVIYLLREIPFSQWPKKDWVFTTFFASCPSAAHPKIAACFNDAADERTRSIGRSLSSIYEAQNHRQSDPFFRQLVADLPHIHNNFGWIENNFKRSYPPFILPDYHHPVSPNVKRLNFSSLVAADDLLIGVHYSADRAYINGSYTTLVAYDLQSEELRWTQPIALPSDASGVTVLNTPFGLAMPTREGGLYSREVKFYDPQTGAKKPSIYIPEVFQRGCCELYFTPSGHVFFYHESELYAAHLLLQKIDAPYVWRKMDHAVSLAHCSGEFIIHREGGPCALITARDAKHIFANCERIDLFGSSFVRFERKDLHTVQVIIQQIEEGADFVFTHAKPQAFTIAYSAYNNRYGIDNVAMGKHMLMFNSGNEVCFINLRTNKVRRHKLPFWPARRCYIDPQTNTVWLWNSDTTDVFRCSESGLKHVGHLRDYPGTKLSFARNDVLYVRSSF